MSAEIKSVKHLPDGTAAVGVSYQRKRYDVVVHDGGGVEVLIPDDVRTAAIEIKPKHSTLHECLREAARHQAVEIEHVSGTSYIARHHGVAYVVSYDWSTRTFVEVAGRVIPFSVWDVVAAHAVHVIAAMEAA